MKNNVHFEIIVKSGCAKCKEEIFTGVFLFQRKPNSNILCMPLKPFKVKRSTLTIEGVLLCSAIHNLLSIPLNVMICN